MYSTSFVSIARFTLSLNFGQVELLELKKVDVY